MIGNIISSISIEQVIVFLLGFLYFQLFVKYLDIKTRYNDTFDELSLKYVIIFSIFNVFCFFFLKQIKESRKIDYFKKSIIEYGNIRGLGIYNKSHEKEIRQMVIYLKLKKIKRKTKPSYKFINNLKIQTKTFINFE